jgi:hypothetical protein
LGHIIGLVELEVVGVCMYEHASYLATRSCLVGECWCPINIGRGRVGRSTRGVVMFVMQNVTIRCVCVCVCVCRVLGVGLS